jgi:hypothetical protein
MPRHFDAPRQGRRKPHAQGDVARAHRTGWRRGDHLELGLTITSLLVRAEPVIE